MAGSVNKVILVGNLGRDPEVKSMQDGRSMVNMSIATSETWRDRQTGERKERTEWHRVVIFNEKLAEVAQKFVRKGSKIYVEGQLSTRKWTDQSGQERYTTEVVIPRFGGALTMLDGRGGGGGGAVRGGGDDDGMRRRPSGGGGGGGRPAARGGKARARRRHSVLGRRMAQGASRIWYQSFCPSRGAGCLIWRALQALLDSVAGPGVRFEVHGLDPPDHIFHPLTEFRCAAQIDPPRGGGREGGLRRLRDRPSPGARAAGNPRRRRHSGDRPWRGQSAGRPAAWASSWAW